jgi:hypothetical protein
MQGARPHGGQRAAVMDFDMYADMSADDLDALVAYLRSLPRIENKMPPKTDLLPSSHQIGPGTYKT